MKVTNASPGMSIVIPCYNEEPAIPNLAEQLRELQKAVAGQYPLEWIFVDDGSTDNTVATIEQYCKDFSPQQFVRHPANRGLTAALDSGFKIAGQPWTACLDADCTYPPLLLLDLYEAAQAGFDVVTASPYHSDGAVENVARWRIFLSQAASQLYRWLATTKLSCYTCCVRIYRTSLLQSTPTPQAAGFVGVTELLCMLDRSGAKIGEVPAVLRPRQHGTSKMQTCRTTLRHLRLLLRLAITKGPAGPTV